MPAQTSGDEIEDALSPIEQNGGVGAFESEPAESVTQRWLFPRFHGATDPADMYLSRSGLGPYESDVETVVAWLSAPRNIVGAVLALGEPGTGKTALIEVAYEGGAYTVMGSDDTERADFEGSYVQTADGNFIWVDGPLIHAMEEGVPLFVDEIGLISPKVLSLLYAAMDGRQEIRITANPERGIVKAKPGFMVVAATNPHAPGVRLSEALLSRFVAQAEMNTDWNVARHLGLDDTVASALENLDRKRLAGEIAGSPQMREALGFIKTAAVFGQELALANLVAASQENDRDVIADVLSRATGEKVSPLALD